MNAKGINKLEQHVEKIVLAVAAAGALYMGYLAIQPVNLPQNTNVRVGNVEDAISDKVRTLRDNQDANAHLTVTPQVTDYVRKYSQLIGTTDQPTIPSELVTAHVPPMGPTNAAVNGVINKFDQPLEAATPMPVPPESLTADAYQQQVNDAPPVPPGAAPATPAVPPVLHDKNAVLVGGYIPVGKMLVDMASQRDKAALPLNDQRVSIYRIEVQRRDRVGNQWSAWSDIAPAKSAPTPAAIDWKNIGIDVNPTMDQVDGEFKQIVIPDFYTDAQGAAITSPQVSKPAPADIQTESKKLQDDLAKAKNQPLITRADEAAPTAMPTDPATIRAQMIVPFDFWDETVEPGHRYQYQVRVIYVNPTFNFTQGLKDAAMKDKPTLASAWSPVPGEVLVNSDMEFFVMGNEFGGNSRRVSVHLFKRTAGKWYYNEIDVEPGTTIAGKIALVDQQPVTQIDVDTGYRLVDAVHDGSSNTHAVLTDPSGNLVTRDSQTDRNDPANLSLFQNAVKRPTPATAPATAPAPNPTGGTRGRGPGGRGPTPPG